MCTNSRQLTWHGIDANLETCLFEYGLVVRYVPKEKSWQCIYCNGSDSFSYGWMSEYDLKEMFISGWAKEYISSFCQYLGVSWLEWLESSVASRIFDVVSYFGVQDIFGIDTSGGKSIKDICNILKISCEYLAKTA